MHKLPVFGVLNIVRETLEVTVELVNSPHYNAKVARCCIAKLIGCDFFQINVSERKHALIKSGSALIRVEASYSRHLKHATEKYSPGAKRGELSPQSGSLSAPPTQPGPLLVTVGERRVLGERSAQVVIKGNVRASTKEQAKGI